MYEMAPVLFARYVGFFHQGRQAPAGRLVGGMFRVFYTGKDMLQAVDLYK